MDLLFESAIKNGICVHLEPVLPAYLDNLMTTTAAQLVKTLQEGENESSLLLLSLACYVIQHYLMKRGFKLSRVC